MFWVGKQRQIRVGMHVDEPGGYHTLSGINSSLSFCTTGISPEDFDGITGYTRIGPERSLPCSVDNLPTFYENIVQVSFPTLLVVIPSRSTNIIIPHQSRICYLALFLHHTHNICQVYGEILDIL
jgi:hypothetical protein